MLTTNINLDVSKTGVQSTVYVSQGDTDSRRIVISLTNFGHSVDIDDDCFAVLMGRIGSTEFNTQCEIKNNKIYFDIKSGHTLQSGTINANIRIQKQGKILYSPKFNIVVADTFNNEGTVIDTSGYTDFSSAITDMENLQKKNISSVVITDTEVDGVTAHKVDINFVDISMSPVTFTVKDGKQGLKGDKGDTGPQGIQGEKGDKGEQGIPGRDAYQFFEIMSTGRDLISISEGVYLAISDLTIKNRNSTAKKDLLIYKNTFFSVEVGVLSNTHELTFYGECEFDGEKKPYSSYRLSTNGGYLVDVTTYNSLLNKINELQSDTTDSFQGKQDKLTAGAGIKIDDNVISADTQFSLVKASGRSEVGYSYPVPDVDNPKSNAIYLVPIENPETDDDYHYEWLWDDSYQNGAWELLGTTSLSTIPRKTSELENDSNFVSDANYVHSDNNFTVDEKNKLASLHKFEVGDGLTLENGVLSLNIPTADSNTVYGGEV